MFKIGYLRNCTRKSRNCQKDDFSIKVGHLRHSRGCVALHEINGGIKNIRVADVKQLDIIHQTGSFMASFQEKTLIIIEVCELDSSVHIWKLPYDCRLKSPS